MTEERRVTRREPVTTVVVLDNGKEATFAAVPLPWRKRIEYGEALNRMYSASFNQMLQGIRNDADELVGIEGTLFEASMDYPALFALGYPDRKVEELDALDFDQMIEVLHAVLTVNGLGRLTHMLDPDRKKVLTTGESEPATAATIDAGEKTDSATDSG
jgi:hypothetical protein